MIQITHVGFLVVVDGVILPKYISKDAGLYTAYYKQQFLNTLDITNSMCTRLWKLRMFLPHSFSDLSALNRVATANIVIKTIQYQELRGTFYFPKQIQSYCLPLCLLSTLLSTLQSLHAIWPGFGQDVTLLKIFPSRYNMILNKYIKYTFVVL